MAAASVRRTWSELTPPARTLRVVHAGIAAIELWALGSLWSAAIRRRRDRSAGVAVALLLAEGAGLTIGRGNCPLGPLQRKVEDPTPLFELVLPPRAAKAAVPVLVGASVAGLLALIARPPR